MIHTFWDAVFQHAEASDTHPHLPVARGEQVSALAYAANTQRQVFELSVTMGVLVRMLHEAGLVDRDVLRARAAAELAQKPDVPVPSPAQRAPVVDPWQTPPPPQAALRTAGDPYRAAPIAEPMVWCMVCGCRVAERLTVITERGTVCDVCAARGSRR